ncbi:hypothetical protein ACN9MF_11200 [Methylobacterium fujisawaense]
MTTTQKTATNVITIAAGEFGSSVQELAAAAQRRSSGTRSCLHPQSYR